jgi:hypothetical protein
MISIIKIVMNFKTIYKIITHKFKKILHKKGQTLKIILQKIQIISAI